MPEPVAIVHDWLTSMRGGERVVEALYGVFPQADLFTLTWDPERLSPALASRRVTTSPVHAFARAPFVSGRFRALLPLFPLAIESFKLNGYGLVVSSSHCVAIGAIAPPTALHVAYVHSTLRYVREAQSAYEASVPGGALGRALFRGAAHYLRRWETAASARPHALIANSTYTRDRIQRYYHRDALVIEPPIETERFERAAAGVGPESASAGVEAPFLVVSALVPNKRVDLALRAFQGRTERLVVVGEGPERARIEGLAGGNVTLLGRVEEGELAALYARCRALIHPGVDDFGMVMVEALAAGKPVIACAEGGALDIVRDGETGLLIGSPTVDGVRAALDRFAARPMGFDPAALRGFARRFDRANFERRFAEAVEDARRARRYGAESRGNGSSGGRGGAGPNGKSAVGVTPVSHSNGMLNGHHETGAQGRRSENGVDNGHQWNSVASGPPGIDAKNGHSNGVHAGHSNGVHTGPSNGVHTGPSNGVHTGPSNGVHTGPSNGVHAGHSNRVHNGHSNGASNGHHGNGVHVGLPETDPSRRHAFEDRSEEPAIGGTLDELTAEPPFAPAPARPVALAPTGTDDAPRFSRAAERTKHLIDVALAATGLVMTAPLVACLAGLVRLDSKGPAFFYQRRTGMHQRPFTLVKLRTMDEAQRVTRVGCWLRPLGLDELPQLWNVLKGDMSLVGPRPEIPQRVARFESEHPGYVHRHRVRPGITGWAQVNGLRGNVSIADRLRFDIQYLSEWSPALDCIILARTVSTVLGDTRRESREARVRRERPG